MHKFHLPSAGIVAGLAASVVLALLSSGCVSDAAVYGRTTGYYRSGHPQSVVVYYDDYDYYPAYRVYYSRTRREYVYLDGDTWVRSSRPSGVSLDVLLSTPSVRMDFHDDPRRHDRDVYRRYPRDWHRDHRGRNHGDDRHDRWDDDDHDHHRG